MIAANSPDTPPGDRSSESSDEGHVFAIRKGAPKNHRTVDRVTRILEEVVYHPGMTFAEIVRALGAAKSSVHGFMQGLLANGWLYEDQSRFYIGPVAYGLTLATGQLRAGLVTHDDLSRLHKVTGVSVFLGTQAGDHLIYISEAGSHQAESFESRTNIRRPLLLTAGGRAILASATERVRTSYLRRCNEDKEIINSYLHELAAIQRTGIVTHLRRGSTRFAIATVLRNPAGDSVASITLVGPASLMTPRVDELSRVLLQQTENWAQRSPPATSEGAERNFRSSIGR